MFIFEKSVRCPKQSKNSTVAPYDKWTKKAGLINAVEILKMVDLDLKTERRTF